MKRLFRIALLAAIGLGVYKLIEEKKNWTGLTEDEARDKLNTKLSPRVPPEKLAQVTDQIVEQMKARGVLRTEPAVGNGSGV
jgi:hypothetical protein